MSMRKFSFTLFDVYCLVTHSSTMLCNVHIGLILFLFLIVFSAHGCNCEILLGDFDDCKFGQGF